MNSTKIALIVLYILLMIASMTMYGLWLAANPVDNEITQLILLILIVKFLHSFSSPFIN